MTPVIGGFGSAKVVHSLGNFVPGAGFGNGFVHTEKSVNTDCLTHDTAPLKIPDNGTTRVIENLAATDDETHD